jgi:ribonucleoside-diphosphate reductase alpha chain
MEIVDVIDILKKLNVESEGINNWKNGADRTLAKYVPNGTKARGVCKECGIQPHYEEGCLKCGCDSKCG